MVSGRQPISHGFPRRIVQGIFTFFPALVDTSVDGKSLCLVLFLFRRTCFFFGFHWQCTRKEIFPFLVLPVRQCASGPDSTNAAFDFYYYLTLRAILYISLLINVNSQAVCQINRSKEMAGISFHPQQDTARERPHLDVVLDNQYLVLKGSGPDVDPTTLSGHVRLVLTEPTSIKEITLQFKGKARILSYDFLLLSSNAN